MTVLALTGLLLQSNDARAADDTADLVERLRSSVVTVLVYRDAVAKTPDITGTGWFKEDGQVVTNYHVIRSAQKVQVRTSDGSVFESPKLLGFDSTNDVAVIAVNTGKTKMKPLVQAKDAQRVGDKVIVIGSPLGLDLTVTDGIISSMRKYEGVPVIQITAAISPGSSGSPVFNSQGEVIGVATFTRPQGQLLNFAIPVSAVEGIKRQDAEWKRWGNRQGSNEDAPLFGEKDSRSLYDELFALYRKECQNQRVENPILWKSDGGAIGHMPGAFKIFQVIDDTSALFSIAGGDDIFRISGTDCTKAFDGQRIQFESGLVFIRTGSYRYNNVLGQQRTVVSFSAVDANEFKAAKERYYAKSEAEKATRLRELLPQLAAEKSKLEECQKAFNTSSLETAKIREYDTKRKALTEKIRLYEAVKERPNIAPIYARLTAERDALGKGYTSEEIEAAKQLMLDAENKLNAQTSKVKALEAHVAVNRPAPR